MMMPSTDIAALILAAGESRRMGSPKALLPLGSKTALERSVNLFSNAGIQDIRVVTGHLAGKVRGRLPHLPVQWTYNEAFQQGMFSSVQKGIAAIDARRAWFFVLPVDIPLVRPQTLSTLLAACPAMDRKYAVLHPTFMGRQGHPPLIATRLIPGILSWEGQGGLDGFLSTHHTDTMEIPVIDEFIERDMDTPADYQWFSTAFTRYHIPTSAECEAMLTDPKLFSEGTAAHCRVVSRLAVYFGKILAASNVPLDIERIKTGALLHDIAKGKKNHAATGAEMLSKMGFSGVADIVSAHMDINGSETPSLNEREVVYLSDKLVRGDTLVPLSVRFEHKQIKYGHDPSALAAIIRRKTAAEAIVKRMEQVVGKTFQAIMNGFPQDPK